MKLVKVTWDDAEDPSGQTWVEDDDLDGFMQTACVVTSVGFLARETESHILLVADRIPHASTYGRVTKIPRGMILSLEELF